jgi:hypothetical protein
LVVLKRIVKEYIHRKTNFGFPCKPTVETVMKHGEKHLRMDSGNPDIRSKIPGSSNAEL